MKKRLFVSIFVVGITMGVFWGMSKVRASSPVGEKSGGDDPASVHYEEVWKAADALISTRNKFQYVGDISDDSPTMSGPQLNPRVFPKMLVTKWKVHGHIHFQ